MPIMSVALVSVAVLAALSLRAGEDSAPPPAALTPEATVARLRTQVKELLAKLRPELFARHLRSMLALAEESLLRLSLNAPDHDAQAKELVEYVSIVTDGLTGDAALPENYLRDGNRSLVLARLSKVDSTIQYAMVSLPQGWNPDREYPLVVSLHGFGPSNPLAYSSWCFQFRKPDEKPSSKMDMVSLSPWGRGNLGWAHDSEADLWEALADLKSFCKIDKDRTYITGHSMGADGVWSLIQRTPDMWAAAGMQAGSMRFAPVELGVLPNIAHLPIHMWLGADDHIPGRNTSCTAARDALAGIGNKVEFVESAGVGHMPRAEDQRSQIEWLLTHVRKRPAHFEFLVDTWLHRGVWGVSAPSGKDYAAFLGSPKPRFSCSIEGNTVHIVTQHTKQLTVDLGPSGLQMTGHVEVILNGKSVFKGPVPAETLDFSI